MRPSRPPDPIGDMMALADVKDAINSFEQVQRSLNGFGAGDTEPDCEFQYMLSQAVQGKPVETEKDANGWQLYSSEPGAEEAARKLSEAAQKACQAVSDCKISDEGVQQYVRGYCWRISFGD